MNGLLDKIIRFLKPFVFNLIFFRNYEKFNSFKFELMYLFIKLNLYESSTFNYLKNKKIKNFIDVGANASLFYRFLNNLNENFNYVGFEPNPSCIKYSKNKYQSINVFQYAIGDIDKVEKLLFVPELMNGYNETALGSLVSSSESDQKIKIIQRTLDSLVDEMNLDNINMIKVDTEGYEVQVLKGAKKIISRDSPEIIIEYHPAYKDELIMFLKEINYTVYSLQNLLELDLGDIYKAQNILLKIK